MKLATPRWWYQRRRGPAPVIRALLTPLSWIWAAATARRIARGVPFDPGVPVICIGGLTVGGAGKTPVAQALAARIPGAAVVSRGYGGALSGPVMVDPARHLASDVGDEPLMLAATATVWVARDRAAGASAAAADGARVLVMDDGHQNPSLKKALSIVVVDGETRRGEWPFGDGRVFPAGPMREPLAVGLARADAVVVVLPTDLDRADPELLALFGDRPVLIARLRPTDEPAEGRWFAFAGIAKPWRFEQSLKAAGVDLADFAAFPDHAPWNEATLERLGERAADLGAGLMTTEKDWVRLPPEWRGRATSWPIRARFEDEAGLDAMLGRVIGRPR